jgi:hypothetical protein
MDPTVSTHADLDAVRIRRAELRGTLDAMERVLAAPARGRAVIWGEAVHAVLGLLADDFGAHVDVTEGPGGLHQAILAGDLRLANAVAALTEEHGDIAAELASLVADTLAPVTPADVDDIRERATRLLAQLMRHRQRGADLIYEAYESDIGGGD